MGIISKFSSVQFESLSIEQKKNLLGVTLVYRSVNRQGEMHESAVNFAGEEFEPKNKTQDEVFRVWKNVVQTFWNTKILEAGLKKDNGGIATKLRSSTPAAIMVNTSDKKLAEQWDIEASIWSRIGLVPTKKDMEECAREYKKKMHRAAQASFTALNFRAKFEDIPMPEEEGEKPAEKSAEKPAEKPAKADAKKAAKK